MESVGSNMSKVIGIIGSRRRDACYDLEQVTKAFNAIYQPGDTIVSGGCPKGGDRFAEMIARGRNIPIKIHYPDWEHYGRTAGIKRNTLIANDADVLIACVSPDRKGGTEDTIRKFVKRGKEANMILVEGGI